MNDLVTLQIVRRLEVLIVLFIPAVLLHVASQHTSRLFHRVTIGRLKAVLFILSFVGLTCVFYDPLLDAAIAAQDRTCIDNMRALSGALLIYAGDWDNTLPPDTRWYNEAQTRLGFDKKGRVIRCPASESPYTYALNCSLGALSLSKVSEPAATVMLFECDASGPNASGNKEFVTREVRLRHPEGPHFAFTDGSVEHFFLRKEWNALRWEP